MTSKNLWWLLPLACLAACSKGTNNKESRNNSVAVADTTGIMSLNAPGRKFIRTADFHCEVANVLTAVNTLERAVTNARGVVQESRVENTNEVPREVYYKPDSVKTFNSYTTTATLTLRVPVGDLDSVVHCIPAMVNFIDSRMLRQSDMTADYTANILRDQASTKAYSAAKAITLAKNPEDVLAIQQNDAENTAQIISRKVAQMRLADEVNYATLTISLVQPPQVYVQIKANPDYFSKVPFPTQLAIAARNGLQIFQAIFVALFTIWPILIIASAFVIYFMRLRRKKNLEFVAQHK